jgi:hypothetical protein
MNLTGVFFWTRVSYLTWGGQTLGGKDGLRGICKGSVYLLGTVYNRAKTLTGVSRVTGAGEARLYAPPGFSVLTSVSF